MVFLRENIVFLRFYVIMMKKTKESDLMEIYKFGRDMLGSKGIAVREKWVEIAYPVHWHDYYEIIYYENCNGICVVNDEEHPITHRCLFLLTPRDFHRIDTQNRSNSRSVNISFSENALEEKLLWDVSKSPYVWYDVSEFSVSIIERLLKIANEKDLKSDILAEHLLSALLIDVLRQGKPVSVVNPYVNSLIGKAMLFVAADLSRRISLKDIAAYCGMTPTYFSSLFHNQTGKSFIRWLTDVRIDRAKCLLTESDSSVLEISLECGYNNFSHFIKTFRQNVGISPTAYRKQFPLKE